MNYAPGVWIDDIGPLLDIVGLTVSLVICVGILYVVYFALWRRS